MQGRPFSSPFIMFVQSNERNRQYLKIYVKGGRAVAVVT
jgi:hypothetical protein